MNGRPFPTEATCVSEIGIAEGKVIRRFPEAKLESGEIAVLGYTPAEAIAEAIELIRFADKASEEAELRARG